MTILKQIGIILLAAAVLAAVSNLIHPRSIPWTQDWSYQVEERAQEEGIRIVSLAMARESDAVFIDARTEREFREGHIPDAVSVPLVTWEEHFQMLVEQIDAGREMIVYCSGRRCDDALLLANNLQRLGADVALMVDGFEGWVAAGGEVEP